MCEHSSTVMEKYYDCHVKEEIDKIKTENFYEIQIEQNSAFINENDCSMKYEDDTDSNTILILQDFVKEENNLSFDTKDESIITESNKIDLKSFDSIFEIKTEVFPDINSSLLRSVKEEIATYQNNDNNKQSNDTKKFIINCSNINKKQYACSTCKKSYTKKQNLNRHMIIHKNNNQPYICDICKKSFTRKDNLKMHITIHTNNRQYKCDICKILFLRNDNLKRHIFTHFNNQSYKCDICKTSFTRLDNLKIHIANHIKNIQYKCDNCKKSFLRKSNLKRHMVKCDISKKPSQKNIKKTQVTHTYCKQYKCDVCKISFSRNGNLKRHGFTHMNNQSYKCDICKTSFTRLDNLKKHITIHINNM